MQNTNRKCRLNAQTIILTASFARLWNQASLQAALNVEDTLWHARDKRCGFAKFWAE